MAKGFAVDLALLPPEGARPSESLVDLLQVANPDKRQCAWRTSVQSYVLLNDHRLQSAVPARNHNLHFCQQGSDGAICVVADEHDIAACVPAGMVSGAAAVHQLLTRSDSSVRSVQACLYCLFTRAWECQSFVGL